MSNIILDNKVNCKGNQTHIHIPNEQRSLFYDAKTISDFKAGLISQASTKTIHTYIFFNANIQDMLNRRATTKDPHLKQPSSHKPATYAKTGLCKGTSYSQLSNEGRSPAQLHISIGNNNQAFDDFRFGIQIYDYLLLFKNIFTDEFLAISIPFKFAQRFGFGKKTKMCRQAQNKPSKKDILEEAEDDSKYDDSINCFMSLTNVPKPVQTPPKALPPKKPMSKGKGKGVHYVADPSIGLGAIDKANYTCELCGDSTSFPRRTTNKPYMEAHHLIPISKQDLFGADIDITSNLICLCPKCHKQIHYGANNDVKQLLRKLLTARKAALKTCGIDIEEDTLFSLYKLK